MIGTGILGLLRLVSMGLVVAAVVKELRTPSEERTWHGVVAGFVPRLAGADRPLGFGSASGLPTTSAC